MTTIAKQPGPLRVRAYACRVAGAPEWGETIYNATSPSKAKRQHHVSVSECYDIPYTAIRCRLDGPPHTSDIFEHVAKMRGMPHVRAGSRIRYRNSWGTAVDVCGGANFVVMFDADAPQHAGLRLAIHPSEITEVVNDVPQREGATP